ncbi:MAG: hypothetical protein PHX18_06875 [Candidatus Gastranaerophilales bacterium]|nr:hypothetical protein [Candidatus Gastranaerophilales bacterium]
MVALLKRVQAKKNALKDDYFGRYLEKTTENTTVNGNRVAKKLSWYKRILGLF